MVALVENSKIAGMTDPVGMFGGKDNFWCFILVYILKIHAAKRNVCNIVSKWVYTREKADCFELILLLSVS